LVWPWKSADSTPGDEVIYPREDLKATMIEPGVWGMFHKDGTPY